MKFLLVLSFFVLASSAPTTYDQRQEGGANVRADLQNILIVAVIPKMPEEGSSLLLNALAGLRRKNLKGADRRNQIVESEPLDDQEGTDKGIEAFVEPKTPYQVDISEAKSNLAKLYPAEDQSPDVYLPQSKSAFSPVLKISPDESPVPNVVPVKDNKYINDLARDSRVIEVVEIGDNLTVIDDKDIEKVDVPEAAEPLPEFTGKNISSKNQDSGLLLLGAMEQCGPDRYRDEEGVCKFIEEDKK